VKRNLIFSFKLSRALSRTLLTADCCRSANAEFYIAASLYNVSWHLGARFVNEQAALAIVWGGGLGRSEEIENGRALE
jgi:hypothetical protein